MIHFGKKSSIKKRRGVSQIIGSLVVLAIVASIGSVILFQGLNQINLFSHDLSLHDRENNQALQEDIIFQHIRFDPNTDMMELYLANTGTTDSTISTVTVVKIDTQDLVIGWQDVNETILIEDHAFITLNATLPQDLNIWNSTYYDSSDYKITVTTSKGNFFSSVANPSGNFNS